MKKLKDLSINSKNVLNKEELVKLKGGTESEGRCGGGNNGIRCSIEIDSGSGAWITGWVCGGISQIRQVYPDASYSCTG